jgi:hypothetical protein
MPSSEGQLEFDIGGCGRRARTLCGLFIGHHSTLVTQAAPISSPQGRSVKFRDRQAIRESGHFEAVALTPLRERDLLLPVGAAQRSDEGFSGDLGRYQVLRGG